MRRNLLVPAGANATVLGVQEKHDTSVAAIHETFQLSGAPTPKPPSANIQLLPILRWRLHSASDPWLLCFTQYSLPVRKLLESLAISPQSIITSTNSSSQAARLSDAGERITKGEHIVAVELDTLSTKLVLGTSQPHLCAIFGENDAVADHVYDILVKAN